VAYQEIPWCLKTTKKDPVVRAAAHVRGALLGALAGVVGGYVRVVNATRS
jgi:hypothetical protein